VTIVHHCFKNGGLCKQSECYWGGLAVNQALRIHLRDCSINPIIGVGLTKQVFSNTGIKEVKNSTFGTVKSRYAMLSISLWHYICCMLAELTTLNPLEDVVPVLSIFYHFIIIEVWVLETLHLEVYIFRLDLLVLPDYLEVGLGAPGILLLSKL